MARDICCVGLLTDTDVGTSFSTVSWTTVTEADISCWVSSDPTKLTVPAGKTVARLIARGIYNGAAGSYYGARIEKAGTTIVSCIVRPVSQSYTAYVDTGWIPVSEGDAFTCALYNSAGGDAAGIGSPFGFASFEIQFPA